MGKSLYYIGQYLVLFKFQQNVQSGYQQSYSAPNEPINGKPNLHFVSRMGFAHFMRYTTLTVQLPLLGRYASSGNRYENMKIRFINFRRVVDVGALSGAGEAITVLLFFIAMFGGLAYFFKEQGGVALFFVILTVASIYALINEVIGIFPGKKSK